VTLFGGFAPTIAELLMHWTGDTLAPAYYVSAAAVISGVSLAVVGWRMRMMKRRA
jgi:MFS transporter, MHS family, proline/betaine transporter